MMQIVRLGPYRLGKKLGQGGMGAVYQGVDESTGQPAAVKILSPHLAGDEGFRVRFEGEIESLKKLNHPNIVRLYGYGEEQGSMFYAMELIDGTSLEDELRAGRRFNWREVTQLTIRLCRALKHAHDHGVIHRDIKPANLLLSESGEIKLSDFGIARLFGNTRLTSDGGVLGTAEYMAPEQADGRIVTDRCDQYSLGGVMYALLAGRPPFRAASLLEMLQMQRYAEPESVCRYAADTPGELDRIIRQLLDKDPQKRFSNTLMLARALEAMERGLSLTGTRDDFVLADADEDPPTTSDPIDSAGATSLSHHSPDSDDIELEVPIDRTAATALHFESHTIRSVPLPKRPNPSTDSPGRFTKVGDETVAGSHWFQQLWTTLLSWQTLAPVVGLLLIGSLVWYAMKPPTADQLYTQIESAADSGQQHALVDALPSMTTFLALYPDDPRAETVKDYALEASNRRDQRRLELKRLGNAAARSPAERALREALFYKTVDPELALAKFRALTDLYGRVDQEDTEWVRQARAEITMLEKQIAEDRREDSAAIEAQLEEADRLHSEHPAEAQKIWQAIVALYGDKPWAESQVERAATALDAMPKEEKQVPLTGDRLPETPKKEG